LQREKKISRTFTKNIYQCIKESITDKEWADMLHIQALAIGLERNIIGNYTIRAI
jgi:hypothetical protein